VKLVRQTLLHFQQGSSDKVYEVDLCEVGPDRYVVNFRYGRRGASLRDGTKTPLPVGRAEADAAFDKLVLSKTKKGYVDVTPRAAAPAAPAPAPRAPAPPQRAVADPRHEALRAHLDGSAPNDRPIDNVLWRASEVRVPGIAPLAARYLDRYPWLVVRAIARSGDVRGLPTVYRVYESASYPDHVRWLAANAIAMLATGDDLAAFAARERERLPQVLANAIGDPVLADAVIDWIGRGEAPDPVERLYLCGPEARAGLLAALPRLPFRHPGFRAVRRLFKAAEMRGDGPVFGALAARFEDEAPAWRRSAWGDGGYHPEHGRVSASDPRAAWSQATRKYLRRRVWRTLRHLGEVALYREYAELAAGLLLADTTDETRAEAPDRRRRWAWNKILHGDDRRWAGDRKHLSFRADRSPVEVEAPAGPTAYRHNRRPEWGVGTLVADLGSKIRLRFEDGEVRDIATRVVDQLLTPVDNAGPALVAPPRGESFERAWDASPDLLVELLRRSRVAEVHAFAAAPFMADPDTWGRFDDADLLALLELPFPRSLALAGAIALRRIDPASPNLELALGVLECADEDARRAVGRLVRDHAEVFLADLDFVTSLCLSRRADTRALAAEVLALAPLSAEHSRALLTNLVLAATATPPDATSANAVLADVANLVLTVLAAYAGAVPRDATLALARHALLGAAELGAKLLLAQDRQGQAVPEDVVAALLGSPHDPVRAVGRRLLASLATADPGAADRILAALLPRLAGAVDDEARDVLRIAREALAPALARLGIDGVFTLLRAADGAVQELGGELLGEHVDPRTLSVAQLAELAGHDILRIREAAQGLLEADVARVQAAPGEALMMFDARWDDTRRFACALFERHLDGRHLDAALLIALCDSVRPDIQAFGRRTITRLFQDDDGAQYLAHLAQHPAPDMQLFTSNYLDRYAAGDAAMVGRLRHYFKVVLGGVNHGRVAKLRVHAFLRAEALADREVATIVAPLMREVARSVAIGDRARAIATLTAIHRRWPDVPVGLTVVSPEVRGAV